MSSKPEIRTTVRELRDVEDGFAKLNRYLSRVVAQDVTVASTGAPTDAELDSAFGTPADVGDGFHAVLDEGGGGSVVYPVYVKNGQWWYGAALTAAV